MATTKTSAANKAKSAAKPKAATKGAKAAPAAVKTTAPTKSAPTKTAAAKTAPAKPAPAAAARKPAKPKVDVELRRHYVEVAAYYIAERRGFLGGCETEDWITAEREIDLLLQAGKLSA